MNRHAEWVTSNSREGIVISPLGEAVANILGIVYNGIHNAPLNVKAIDWSQERYIEVAVRGYLSTWDDSRLTGLVLLAHAACVRVSIEPRAFRYLTLTFHQRQGRTGEWSTRHPTIERAIELWAPMLAQLSEAPS